MVYFTNPDLARSPIGKSSNKGGDLDIEKVAADLVESFSSNDGIASEDRLGFVVDLAPEDDASSSSPCQCDIVTTDCLGVIACMPGLHDSEREKALAWTGIELRKSMKETSDILGTVFHEWGLPLGKTLQYNTMDTWINWRSTNILPAGYGPKDDSIFIREEWYPDCLVYNQKKNRTRIRFGGHSCFYRGPAAEEDSAGIIEEDARRWYDEKSQNGIQTRTKVRTILNNFFEAHQPVSNEQQKQAHFSPLGDLMLYAHTTRMLFNRRSFLDEIYQEKLTSVVMPRSETGSALRSGIASESTVGNNNPFRVALHIRRGDSCGKHMTSISNDERAEYESEASLLDSIAQVGSERMCYKTEVYLDKVRRIRQMVPRERPLHVYLATDDVGDIVNEINATHGTNVRETYGIDVLHYLDYSREQFDYITPDVLTIEETNNTANQPFLGETAVSDLWLLSHGDAFVGHKGSRFGKVSWLLAMARRNNFVPFASVDGHSFCCEIDENCGAMKPFVTVDNCMTFGHEYLDLQHEDYWAEGSTLRKRYFLRHMRAKNKKFKLSKDADESSSVDEGEFGHQTALLSHAVRVKDTTTPSS